MAEEVVGNSVGVGEEPDGETVSERDQAAGELVGGEPDSGLVFADGRVEETSDSGTEACVALCESFGCGGVTDRLAPEVDQQQECVALASGARR